jgi:hypothetical protein
MLVGFVGLILWLNDTGPAAINTAAPAKPSPHVVTGNDTIQPALAAEDFVTRKLKSPATAKYPAIGEFTVTDLGGGAWQVRGYVDSQNSFGADLRGWWTVRLRLLGGRAYEDAVLFDQQSP